MNAMFGSWKISDMTPCNLPQRAASAFTGAFDGFVGANYEPVLYCGKQVVNGTNYAIVCKQSIPAPGGAVERVAMVIINESPDGAKSGDLATKKYSIVDIQNILG